MSNVSTVRSIYEAFDKGDVPAILDLLAENVEWEAWAVLEADLPPWGSGHYRDEEIHLWTFNDQGEVIRLRHYIDTAKHIAAFKL